MPTPLEIVDQAFNNALKIVQRNTGPITKKAQLTDGQIIAAANLALPIISYEFEAIALQKSNQAPEE